MNCPVCSVRKQFRVMQRKKGYYECGCGYAICVGKANKETNPS